MRRPIYYVARFEDLDSDLLLSIEQQHGTCDAPQEYVEQLLVVLADWRRLLIAGARTDADDYRRSLDAVREAWLQYSFRWEGGPALPYPFDLPASVRAAAVLAQERGGDQ